MTRDKWRTKLDKAMNSIEFVCSGERQDDCEYLFDYTALDLSELTVVIAKGDIEAKDGE